MTQGQVEVILPQINFKGWKIYRCSWEAQTINERHFYNFYKSNV